MVIATTFDIINLSITRCCRIISASNFPVDDLAPVLTGKLLSNALTLQWTPKTSIIHPSSTMQMDTAILQSFDGTNPGRWLIEFDLFATTHDLSTPGLSPTHGTPFCACSVLGEIAPSLRSHRKNAGDTFFVLFHLMNGWMDEWIAVWCFAMLVSWKAAI